ncbi:hypothetical protein WJX84_006109 [Apatococcus fuscideae]|uniref:Uncharacterized protein n=1 Tax=Apatococcus fuscideae TaxID=2026836 RepID=A0AAW1TI26_9CHLO
MKGKSYLVTGASRGVGLCLVKELMHKEEEPIIFAAARLPEKYEELQELAKANGRVHIIRLDLTDVQTIKAAAGEVLQILTAEGYEGLDFLIQDAGTSEDLVPPLDTPDHMLKLVFETNAVGPLLVYKYFRPLVQMSQLKTIVNFASNFGSLTLASEPLKHPEKATVLDCTQIAYKASKCAVNMETVIIAEDTRELGFTVISMHPGIVDTAMGSRPQKVVKEAKPEVQPEETAKLQIALYDKLSIEDTGKFFDYRGNILPW